MAKVNNRETLKLLEDGANIQIASEKVPNELAEKIVPTFETNPMLLRRISIIGYGTAINALSANIYTTPTDKDFYASAFTLSIIKDATATSVNSYIALIMADGTVTNPLVIAGLTLTAQNQSVTLALPFPIKIKRGTTISVNNTTNVGNVTAYGNVLGYLVDNT